MENSNKLHNVIVGGLELSADQYHSLLKYILDSIQKGFSKNDIKKTLMQSGWSEAIIEHLYSDKSIDKSQILTKSEIKTRTVEDKNFTSSVDNEKLINLENDLKSAIKEFSRYEGKLESNEVSLGNFSEKLGMLKDSISEIRGMEMSSEKRMSQFETKVEKANSIIADYDPLVLETKFTKLEKEINIQESNLSKFNEKIKLVEDNLDEFLGFMKKIKNHEALISVLDSMKKKVDAIEDMKKDIERNSGKVEGIFIEFQDKLEELAKVKRKSEGYDEMIKDLIKDVDSIATKTKTFVTEDDLATKLVDLSSAVESMKSIVYNKVNVNNPASKNIPDQKAVPLTKVEVNEKKDIILEEQKPLTKIDLNKTDIVADKLDILLKTDLNEKNKK